MDLRLDMPVKGNSRQRTLSHTDILEVAYSQIHHSARGSS
jgi:hypothetical protein